MRILLRLIGYTLPYRGQMALVLVCLVATTAASVAVPRLLGTAIDAALTSGIRSQLSVLAGVIILLSLARGLFGYGQSYLGEAVSQRVAYRLRSLFFEKVQRLSFAFHDRQQTGDLMSKATADVEAIRWFVHTGLLRGSALILLMVTVSVMLVLTDWGLALATLAFLPIVVWRSIVISHRLRLAWTAAQEETGRMTTVLQENLVGIRVVKAFGAEEYEKEKFRHRAFEVAKHSLEANLLHGTQSALMTFLFTAVTGVILWLGGREVVQGRLTPGELAQFIFYMGLLAMPVRMSGWMVNTFARAASAGRRLFDVLDAESPVLERRGARSLPKVQGQVAFHNVSFSYDGTLSVLRDVSFEMERGQLVAIVGGPGSGKTTIVHLVPRFYDVSSGSITIDGIDIRDVTLESLRRNVGIVMQDVFLFSATIGENLAYGAPEASVGQIVRAAKVAQLHDFIMGLPEGYETPVGERGITLSGGQRQRLAIARTLLMDPPVLVLDDSTSSVDVGTEYLIQQALASLMKGRTTFVIAHRLSTVQRADLILVMDEGRIVEQGSHRRLLESGGLYHQLYRLQFAPQEAQTLEAAGGNG